jgi:hypothetical protein
LPKQLDLARSLRRTAGTEGYACSEAVAHDPFASCLAFGAPLEVRALRATRWHTLASSVKDVDIVERRQRSIERYAGLRAGNGYQVIQGRLEECDGFGRLESKLKRSRSNALETPNEKCSDYVEAETLAVQKCLDDHQQ